MISAGKAWTLLTAANARIGARGVAVRTLSDALAHSSVALVWRATGASSLAHTFLAIRVRDEGELAAQRTAHDEAERSAPSHYPHGGSH